jgi:choline dehydrogenase-like flavoprotein
MEIDLAQLDDSAAGSELLRAEICVIGGGIAGLTLAQELVALGHDVLLLEAGGRSGRDELTADEVIQAGYPHAGTMEPKVNIFGGTSLVWGGQLLPLPGDAEWPVSAEELSPYTLRAETLLGADDLAYDARSFFKELRRPAPGLAAEPSELNSLLSKFAPFAQRNLAHTVGRKLCAHTKGRVVFHARVVELLLTSSRDRIEAVLVRAPSGRMHRVEAKQIVVAAGTIETVRLLLASRSIAPEGVGNAHDQVGRNFHDHLTVTAATLRGPARRELLGLRPWIHRGTLHAFKFSAGAKLRGQLDLEPILAHLTIEEPANSGVGAIREFLRARQQGQTAASMRAALPELPGAVRDGALLALSAVVQHRRYVSRRAGVQIRLNVAQRHPSASRITLAQDGRPILDWRIDANELMSLRKFANYLRERLSSDGMDWERSLLDANPEAAIPQMDDARHAMGGACMGLDAGGSVVDRELCVHGLCNLFIASAAVFPDGAAQLPTLPLMALALRLAHHLHRQI